MKIAILGTGMVGQALGSKFVELGHEVTMGSRTLENENLLAWKEKSGGNIGTFNDAASVSEVLFNCTNGTNSLEALSLIKKEHLVGKVLVDLANELEFKDGKLRSLASAENSLARKIQDEFGKTRVVKTFNTLNVALMVNPGSISGRHNVFLSGDNVEAKQTVLELQSDLGWDKNDVVDLGGIDTAVGPEMFMAFWITLFGSGKFGDQALFNVNIIQ